MAQVYGRAGQYAKSEALSRGQKLFIYTAIVTAVLGGVIGFLLAKLFSPYVVIPALILSPLLYYGAKQFEREMDKVSRDRIKFLRGGQAEALVAWLLQDLSNDWHIFNGVQLEESSDIDHIIVGPSGVYCISTKAWRGFFTIAEDGDLLHNGKRTRLLQDTFGQAMRVRDRLNALMGTDVPFVNAVLAVPLGFVDFRGPQRNVWVLHQEDLLDSVERAPKRLSKQTVDRCAKCLAMLKDSAAKVYRRRES